MSGTGMQIKRRLESAASRLIDSGRVGRNAARIATATRPHNAQNGTGSGVRMLTLAQ
jgi:hypothetical protein